MKSMCSAGIVTPALLAGLLMAMGAEPSAAVSKKEASVCQAHITVEPEGATLLVDGVVRDAPPILLADLASGDHLVVLRKPGFREGRFTLALAAGQKLAQHYKLERLTGLLLLLTEPPDVEVYVGGAFRGKTPFLLSDLSVGAHRLKLVKAGFKTKEIDVNLTDRTPRKEEINLVSDTGKLIVISEPPGAQVKLNGVSKGISPCECDRVPEGNVTLELTLEGYDAYLDNVKAAAGQAQKINVALKAIPSELEIVSIPPKARIYVNNEFRGEAPVTIRDLKPGSHRARAELMAHDTMARDVEVKPAAKITEEFRLEQNVGAIHVTTEPAGVNILLNGKEMGVTPVRGSETNRISDALKIEKVPAGKHELSVSMKQYAAKPVTVIVEKDKAISRHFKLERHFVPDYEVHTTAGVVRGVLVCADKDNVKLEVAPGVFKVISANKVKNQRPLAGHSRPE
ncbi:MAG: PEGA domain-containing protein [Verrucomicrobiota bacterium]|nr:PEGA domain-containing protein [Verrucomicrobiota bacterium]